MVKALVALLARGLVSSPKDRNGSLPFRAAYATSCLCTIIAAARAWPLLWTPLLQLARAPSQCPFTEPLSYLPWQLAPCDCGGAFWCCTPSYLTSGFALFGLGCYFWALLVPP